MEELKRISLKNEIDINTREFAVLMDIRDPLKDVRKKFEYPMKSKIPYTESLDCQNKTEDEESVYMCGNSLGLMPSSARKMMTQVMDQWGEWGVYGHDHGFLPWQLCDEQLVESMAKLVGGTEDEVAIMNQLTVNLHFLMISFYRPSSTRYKILSEYKPFPSNQYTLESQIRLHGLDPEEAILSVAPRSGESYVRTEDIISVLEKEGENISLVCMSALNFYTGQFMDMKTITKVAHKVGAFIGWDLAHAVGNVELSLHDWDVDWAVWTSYKYLNSGPGGTGAAFLHSRHFNEKLPYLAGWWGHEHLTRMAMPGVMIPAAGIRKYRMSTPSAFHCATLRASLEIFDSVGMSKIRAKSILLTSYFEYLLQKINLQFSQPILEILTPSDVEQRGAQLSVFFINQDIENLHNELNKKGLICDLRKPNVLRLAPCPLYNSFLDVHKTYLILYEVLQHD